MFLRDVIAIQFIVNQIHFVANKIRERTSKSYASRPSLTQLERHLQT